MIRREDIRHFFDLMEIEAKESELRKRELAREAHDIEQQKRMIEYLLVHLDPKALIAIHQTDYFPYDGILRPSGHFLFPFFKNDNAKKIIEDLKIKHPRITIHFTLNYPVAGVSAQGGWVEWNAKYAILIPVEDFISRITCLNPVDTWIIGSLKLPTSAEILVPEEEYYKELSVYEKLTFKPKIIPYPSGAKIHDAICTRIRKRGYRLMEGGDNDWYQSQSLQSISHFISKSIFLNQEEKDKLLDILATKGYNVWINIFGEMSNKLKKISLPHNRTEWRKIEVWIENNLCSPIFNPTDYEIHSPASEFDLMLLSSSGSLPMKRQQLIAEAQKYPFPEEKEYINELSSLFERLEGFTKELYNKLKKDLSENKDLKWGEFLAKQGII